jgi:hypothetical protein
MLSNNAFERARSQRGRAVLAMDCVLAGTEWAPCQTASFRGVGHHGRPLNRSLGLIA